MSSLYAAMSDPESRTYKHSSLKGKVALITGSTQGLGEATARLFQERGAAGLIITGRNDERGLAVADSLTKNGCVAHYVQADLEDLEECRELIQAVDEHFGKIDILVNAAAYTGRGSIWDTSPKQYQKMMSINTAAPFFLMQGAIRIMERESIEGSIVNISSVASYGSLPMLAAYATSKGALNVMTKNVAYAVMRSRIRVNALAIGWMDTPGEDAVQRAVHGAGDNWLQKAAAQQPFGRLLSTEEVARSIAYCASGESGMMTGCIIDMDQSVMGGGPQPVPPPQEEWAKARGVRYEANANDAILGFAYTEEEA